jgi:glycosyltransferase involved in cell wall biosynthesis
MTPSPDISVIIPTYNRPCSLAALLERLLADSFQSMDIVVVSQDTHAPAGNDPRVRVVQINRPSLTRARNAGIAAATGRLLLFLDDDCLPSPDLVRRHCDLHAQFREFAAVAGGVRDRNHQGTREQLVAFDEGTMSYVPDYALAREEETDFFPGGHVSFKREIFNRLRFDPWFIGNAHFEEVDLALRLRRRGHRFFFSHTAWIDHGLEETGGCRAVHSAPAFMLHRFYNRAFCYAKNVSLANTARFLMQQRHDLEYLSRKNGSHDGRLVIAGLAGVVAGLNAGSVRKIFGKRIYR